MTHEEQEEFDKLKRDMQLFKDISQRGWECASKFIKQLLIRDNQYLPKFVFDDPKTIQEDLEKALYYYFQNKFESK
jgi:hypothetical protein